MPLSIICDKITSLVLYLGTFSYNRMKVWIRSNIFQRTEHISFNGNLHTVVNQVRFQNILIFRRVLLIICSNNENRKRTLKKIYIDENKCSYVCIWNCRCCLCAKSLSGVGAKETNFWHSSLDILGDTTDALCEMNLFRIHAEIVSLRTTSKPI